MVPRGRVNMQCPCARAAAGLGPVPGMESGGLGRTLVRDNTHLLRSRVAVMPPALAGPQRPVGWTGMPLFHLLPSAKRLVQVGHPMLLGSRSQVTFVS